MRSRLHLASLILMILAAGPAPAAELRSELAASFQPALATAESPERQESLAWLEAFYRSREMAPLWVDEGGVTPRGRKLAKLLGLAYIDALYPENYGAAAVATLLEVKQPDLLAELEWRLSLGLIDFAVDLGEGRTAPDVSDAKLYEYREPVDREADGHAGDRHGQQGGEVADRARARAATLRGPAAADLDHRRRAQSGGKRQRG